jgi:hypothetical protein
VERCRTCLFWGDVKCIESVRIVHEKNSLQFEYCMGRILLSSKFSTTRENINLGISVPTVQFFRRTCSRTRSGVCVGDVNVKRCRTCLRWGNVKCIESVRIVHKENSLQFEYRMGRIFLSSKFSTTRENITLGISVPTVQISLHLFSNSKRCCVGDVNVERCRTCRPWGDVNRVKSVRIVHEENSLQFEYCMGRIFLSSKFSTTRENINPGISLPTV